MNPTNFPQNMARKRKEAGERKIEHDLMTPDAKLRKLDRAPGQSKRERERLTNQIAESTRPATLLLPANPATLVRVPRC